MFVLVLCWSFFVCGVFVVVLVGFFNLKKKKRGEILQNTVKPLTRRKLQACIEDRKLLLLLIPQAQVLEVCVVSVTNPNPERSADVTGSTFYFSMYLKNLIY